MRGLIKLGTFLYTYGGAGSTASMVLGNILGLTGLGSMFCPTGFCRVLKHIPIQVFSRSVWVTPLELL